MKRVDREGGAQQLIQYPPEDEQIASAAKACFVQLEVGSLPAHWRAADETPQRRASDGANRAHPQGIGPSRRIVALALKIVEAKQRLERSDLRERDTVDR